MCTCVRVSLEPGTVESHCGEGGVGDVAAARHTQDLQLVASAAQTDQAVVRDLLSGGRTDTTIETTRDELRRPLNPVAVWRCSPCTTAC